ncbi:uncharacterized protein LOC131008380 [Salvia miltiorrhiza]|uniref:uncharacterized protein LOC131008380 n=1 Tax=Salvia miltiorrhiza TaxID=226208 RepID=UPI0025ABFD56|nr:uncharacterized protein LOC131008380 [Salvia miltiorrhiza]
MSGFSNWFDPYGSNSMKQNSSSHSQNSNDPSQNFGIHPTFPNFSWPNMSNPQVYPNNSISQSAPSFQFSSQGHPSQGFQPYGYRPQWYPPPGFSPQGYPSQGYMFSESSRRTSVDGSCTDGGTPSSRRAIQGLENINLSIEPKSNDDEQNANKRRVFYSDAECEVLAQCWINITINSVVENDQKLEKIWKRIAEAYNKNRSTNTPRREPT